MVAYLYRMPAGIPGEITRTGRSVVEPNLIDANYPPTTFGSFVKIVGGLIRTIAASDAASVVYGLLVRPFPTSSTVAGQALAAGVPSLTDPCSVLRSGYINVKLARGTAVRGGGVGLRVTAGTHVVGEIEDLTNVGAGDTDCVQVVGATFMGSADANGNVEIGFNL